MEEIDKKVAQRLKNRYIFALLVLAFLTIFGQIIVQISLKEASDDAHIINVAGRQRMLSQRLIKISLIEYSDKFSSEIKQNYKNDFNEVLNEWSKTHEALKTDNLTQPQKYVVSNSIIINDLYSKIDTFFNVLNTQFSNKSSFEIQSLVKNEKRYLEIQNEIVKQYDKESTDRLSTLKKLEYVLGFLTLLTILVEAFMIFSPLTNYVQKVIEKLSKSQKKQIETNENLRFSNKMLLEAQEKLEQATREKYEIQNQEDNVKSASLLEGQEQERKRMSREMHDGVGQLLTGIKLTAAKLNYIKADHEKYTETVKILNDLITDTIEATRVISFNLMPSVLQDYGLVPVFNILKMQSEASFGIKVNLDIHLEKNTIPKNIEIGVYRIVQEALNNTLKYAESEEFNLTMNEFNRKLKIEISDKGKGFDLEKFNAEGQNLIHNGIVNMQTRTKLLGGIFKLDSAPNKGTFIFIEIPLNT